jgi:hypothetical protein
VVVDHTSIVDICVTTTGIEGGLWLQGIATGLRGQVDTNSGVEIVMNSGVEIVMNSGVAIVRKAAQETGNTVEAAANNSSRSPAWFPSRGRFSILKEAALRGCSCTPQCCSGHALVTRTFRG